MVIARATDYDDYVVSMVIDSASKTDPNPKETKYLGKLFDVNCHPVTHIQM